VFTIVWRLTGRKTGANQIVVAMGLVETQVRHGASVCVLTAVKGDNLVHTQKERFFWTYLFSVIFDGNLRVMRNIWKILLLGCLAFFMGTAHGQDLWQPTSDPAASIEPSAAPDPLATEEDPPTECYPSPDPDTQPDPYCPLDGGLVFLLIAGAGYGIKKYGSKRNHTSGTVNTPL
jgi:hypothetical protein